MADAQLLRAVAVIAAAAVAIGIATRLRLPPVLGYLTVGVILGPYALSLFELDAYTRFLAELGVIFLMFMVGLDFSLPELTKASADVLGAGFLQVFLTCGIVFAGATAFGLSIAAATVLAAVVAMSSTALIHKQLADQHDQSALYGRLAIAILLFQDFAALPFLVFVGAWRDGGAPSAFHIASQFAIAVGLLLVLTLVFRPLFRHALRGVARTRSPDLFLLTVLSLALGAAIAVNAAGLAAAIGAFLAGMVVGESEFRHRVEDDIRPFRDFLVGLFFITVGMAVDLQTLVATPLAVAGWLLVFLIGKPLIVFVVGAVRRWPHYVTLRVAMTLAHGGEFGLLLLTLALAAGIVSPEVGQPLLVALTLSMALAPILTQHSGAAARWLDGAALNAREAAETTSIKAETNELNDHVILCGCGRIGRLVAYALKEAGEPYVAIEADHERYEVAKRSGCRVIFGDGGSQNTLDALGLQRASTVAITFDRLQAVQRVLDRVRSENPSARTIVSTAEDHEVQAIRASGAHAVFLENLAAGLGLAREVLVLQGRTPVEATAAISRVPTEPDAGSPAANETSPSRSPNVLPP